MKIVDIILSKLGLIRKSKLDDMPNICKILDEYREEVEILTQKDNLNYLTSKVKERNLNYKGALLNTTHLATLDTYLVMMFYLSHGHMPNEDDQHGKFACHQQKGKCKAKNGSVRPRPKALSPLDNGDLKYIIER